MHSHTLLQAVVLIACLAACGSAQTLEESLQSEYPQYARDIQRLFDQNPRAVAKD